MTIKTKYMSYQKIGVIDMDFYGWRIKEWRFNSSNIEEKHQEMKSWIKKWQRKYRIEQIYVNNAWAVQYRLLLKQQFLGLESEVFKYETFSNILYGKRNIQCSI